MLHVIRKRWILSEWMLEWPDPFVNRLRELEESRR